MSIYIIETMVNDIKTLSKVIYESKDQYSYIRFELGSTIFESTDHFPFFALVKIRLQLESVDMFLACNGSRIDVYPSGLYVSSLLAYELKMGHQATQLVNIFEPCNDLNLIASVKKQKEYRYLWSESL